MSEGPAGSDVASLLFRRRGNHILRKQTLTALPLSAIFISLLPPPPSLYVSFRPYLSLCITVRQLLFSLSLSCPAVLHLLFSSFSSSLLSSVLLSFLFFDVHLTSLCRLITFWVLSVLLFVVPLFVWKISNVEVELLKHSEMCTKCSKSYTFFSKRLKLMYILHC